MDTVWGEKTFVFFIDLIVAYRNYATSQKIFFETDLQKNIFMIFSGVQIFQSIGLATIPRSDFCDFSGFDVLKKEA